MNRIIKQVISNNNSRFYSSSSGSAGSTTSTLFPSVKRLLDEYGIKDINKVKATGPKNRIIKGDVLNYIKSNNLSPLDKSKRITPSAAAASTTTTTTTTASATAPKQSNTTTVITNNKNKIIYEDIPNNNIRKVIANKLTQSKQQAPHFYMTVECELDEVLAMRKSMPDNVKISVNDFVLRACALALRDNPLANSKWSDEHGCSIPNSSVDISFAVSTEKGLITPIITNTDKKQLLAIANESKSLATKARDGKLKPEEFIGGTFSVSNLGMFGITQFSAIINYPQAGILAIGTGRKVIRPPTSYSSIPLTNNNNNNIPNNTNNNNIINTNGPMTIEQLERMVDSNTTTTINNTTTTPTITHQYFEQPKIANVVDITLSGDNRVFDDEIAAKFLSSFKNYLSNPKNMIL